MNDKLKIEISSPNIEMLYDLVELMRDILDDYRSTIGTEEARIRADEYIERFIKILKFD